MQNILLFAVLGLGEGALIAALAMSVVVFYRGSGTVNLSMGAVAMVGSYLYYSVDNGALGFRPPWWLAFIIVLIFVAILGTIIELGLFWPLRGSSPLAKLAASLGLLLLAQSIIAIVYGNSTLSPTSVLPSGVFHLFGAVVPVDRMILAGIAIVLGVALWALYRFSQFGLSTRAAAESERYAMYAGVSPRRLSLVNSLLASIIAGAFGILVAPLITLNTTTLPLEIVPALGAALFAGFSSLGVACFAGLLMGAGASLLNYWASQSWFPQSQGNPLNGLAELLFFVLVAIAMFWRGSKVPARGEITEKRMPLAPRPEHLTRFSVIGLVAGVVLLIILPYEFRQAMVNSMLGAMICLSLIVVVGFVGQISVVQVGLAGVTGYAMSHMLTSVGGVWADFPLALLVGIGCALIVGFITAVASLRVRGVSLAVVTLAGMYAIENFGFGNAAWGQQNSGSPVNPLHIFGLNLSPTAGFRGLDGKVPSPVFGFVVLVVLILLCLLVAAIRRATTRAEDARRPLQRARGGGRGHRRAAGQADRVHGVRADRGHRRRAVRLQLPDGQLRPVRHGQLAGDHRLRLLRRHHDDHRRAVRRARRDPGPHPAGVRHLVGAERQLGPADRRDRPPRDARRQPRRRGGHGLLEAQGEGEAARAGGRRGGCGRRRRRAAATGGGFGPDLGLQLCRQAVRTPLAAAAPRPPPARGRSRCTAGLAPD